ncbi:UNVERIFIED_CONTAM: hypothetical protein NY100_33305, partial [Prevotella sp. 15_C9]
VCSYSMKHHTPKAYTKFILKFVADVWRECTIWAVLFRKSLMAYVMYLLPGDIISFKDMILFLKFF